MKYAILLFDTEINLGISTQPMRFFNYDTLYFDNGIEALSFYMNPPDGYKGIPMKLVQGEDDDALAWDSAQAIEEMNTQVLD